MNEIECKEINRSYFNSKIPINLKDETATILLFYKPECKFCQEFIPTYNRICKQVLFLKTRALNISKNEMLLIEMLKYKPNFISTFPAIFFYDNCEPIYKYEDDRTKDKIIQSLFDNFKDSKNLIIYK